jgi:raffinose/stachyose/melibiose transport system permease protein
VGNLKKKDHFLIHLLLIILVVFELAPVMLLFVNSFREDADIKTSPIGFIKKLDLSNYLAVWKIGNYGQAFINTVIVVICTIIIVVILGSLASYALAKLNIPGQKFFIAYFIITMGIPAQAFIIPLYFMFSSVGLVNKLIGVIIIYGCTNLPFSIFLLRSFMLGIPKEIEEASRVDGCTSLQVYLKIIVPLSKPVLTTVATIVGVAVWNEFLFANTFLQLP